MDYQDNESRSPYEQVTVGFALLAAVLLAVSMWVFRDWFPSPKLPSIVTAAGVPIAGAAIGLLQTKSYGRGYRRFGAAIGFLLGSLLVFAGGWIFMGIAALYYM
ncbi:hypothetical protein AB0M95_07710 [Sphaerisporangium sp. NPDC051017]|uniref:hypothetical protein n=1 Tax=Sphaerisporangium sp. NPDC051017 TaxID=3154636 RepID=UPI0034362407